MNDGEHIPAGQPPRSSITAAPAETQTEAAPRHQLNGGALDPAEERRLGRRALFAAVGIILVAANLRPAVVSVSPLIAAISGSFGFSSSTAGLLTTLPVLFFGISALIAPRLAYRFGIEPAIFAALSTLLLGIALRPTASSLSLFAGSILIGTGIGVCNVLVPTLIKRDFAHLSGLMSGLYSMALSGGAAVAAGLTVPLDNAFDGNWRIALAAWGVPVIVAMAYHLPQLRRGPATGTVPAPSGVWRDPTAWAITIYTGSQGLIFYTFGSWLPKFLIDDRGFSPTSAGSVFAGAQTVGLACSLLAPIVASLFKDQRVVALGTLGISSLGFVGLLAVHQWQPLWASIIMIGPGSAIGLAMLFMVLRTNSTTQASNVSGMAQSLGYILAAIGPILIGSIHDSTGSWTVAMTILACAAIPQGAAAWHVAKPCRVPR